MALDIADGQIQTIHSIANPDKLRHLDRVDDRAALSGLVVAGGSPAA